VISTNGTAGPFPGTGDGGARGGELGLVQKTVAVVRTVAGYPEGVGLSDLSRVSGIAKATCHRIVTSLEAEGWLVSDPLTRRVRLSLDLIFMTEGLTSEESVTRGVRDVLSDVARATGETAGVDRLSGDQAMVIVEVPGPHLIGHAPRRVPRLLSSWRTSTGRVLLAWNDPDVARASFERDAAQPPRTSFETYDELAAELTSIRARGYAVTQSQLEQGLTAVAAPVRVHGQVTYALWTSGPHYRLTDDRLGSAVEVVVAQAQRLGALLERTGAGPGATAFAAGY